MKSNKLISIILTVVMAASMLPSINTKADAGGGGSPQVIINNKTYDATLSNPRTANGNTTYDVYVKVPDCNMNRNLDFTSIDKESDQIQSKTSNYPNSKEISLLYNGQTYNGTLNKQVDVADSNSKSINKYSDTGYDGTAYKYVSQDQKTLTIKDYLYNKDMVDSSGNLLPQYQNASVSASFNAVKGGNLDIGRAIVKSSGTDESISMYAIDGVNGNNDAFLASTDGTYSISSSTMRNNSRQTPDSIEPCSKDTFIMLNQSAFQQYAFPNIEAWQWRTDGREDINHASKIGNTWFTVSPDTTLSDVKVKTTNDPIYASYFDVSTDIYLSNGSMDNAKAALSKLPATIIRDMHAFSRDSVSYYIGGNPFKPVSGSPMDAADFQIEQDKLSTYNYQLYKLLGDTDLGSVNFSKSNGEILWLDKSASASSDSQNGVVSYQSGYYLRILGQYHYGACNITHKIYGNIAINHYVGAIHYAGTVTCGSTPTPTPTPTTGDYKLNISYVDEDTNQTIADQYTQNCEKSKGYEDRDLTAGANSVKWTYYLPTKAPSGYTLDTSKYKDPAQGYRIMFNMGFDLGLNGDGAGKTADLKVYCKSGGPVNPTPDPTPTPTIGSGTVIKRYFLDGVEQTADEKTITDVVTGKHTYSVDRSYLKYTCTNPTVDVEVTADSTTYCDFNFGFVNHPPTVELQAPSTVVMGDDFDVNASGVDPDGDSLTYDWTTPEDFKGSTNNYTASGYFDNTGDKTFSVTVTDPYGASGSDSKVVKVVPPIPNVVIDKSGTEKENRKVTLNAEKYSSSGSKSRYPLDWSKAKWQFFDSNGKELQVDNDKTSSTLIKSLNSTAGTKSMDLLFKKAGKYTAKCTLYNTAGYSNSFTVTLNITPDLVPTADFNLDSNTGYRNPKDLSPNGLAQGTTVLTDNSSSSDNDNINKRMWIACFDSDNDGSYINITNNEDGTKKAVPEKERWYIYDFDYNGDSDTRYKVQVPDSTPLNGNLVTIGQDGHKYAYVNDSLNPHWRYVGSYDDVLKLDINKINCGNLSSVNFKSTSVGKFNFEEVVQECFGQETIPELITNNDIKVANTFSNIH